MAAAKIATLAIRTLAKPIAVQIKHQAQSHERFRSICISLAQFMHRTEMALRTNLLATAASRSSEKAKVRPLNEAKAVTNGANALAEGFLFLLAAGLIVGESYRGSRSRAKQRDRTEEGLEELTMVTKALAERMHVDYEEIERRVKEMHKVEDAVREIEEEEKKEEHTESSHSHQAEQQRSTIQTELKQLEKERDRLQHAVSVLLRLALKSGWIQGQEGLHLQSILDGTDQSKDDKAPTTPNSSPILTQIAATKSTAEQQPTQESR
jgi:hypothetical protein